jgi:Na+-translocating ferredoxin:NAD+ oxidoreductase RnfD subunit
MIVIFLTGIFVGALCALVLSNSLKGGTGNNIKKP